MFDEKGRAYLGLRVGPTEGGGAGEGDALRSAGRARGAAAVRSRPVGAEERLDVLDAVRGFSLAGVLLANLVSFAGYYVMTPAQAAALPTARADGAVVFAVDLFVEGKFYSLFSLLFGVGFALQRQRAEGRGQAFTAFFRRRMLVLLAIGLFHLFVVWHGDILTMYALMGLVLLAVGGAPGRTLLRTVAVLVGLPFAIHAVIWLSHGALDPLPPSRAFARWVQESAGSGHKTLFELRSSGELREVFLGNLVNALERPGRYLESGRPAKVLAMFLLGVWVGRHLNAEPAERAWFLRRVLRWGLVAGLAGSSVYAAIRTYTGQSFSLSGLGLAQTAAYALGIAPLALAYAAALALAWERPAGRRWLSWFTPIGRMAITNYLTQTLIGLFLFYGYGFTLMGRVGAVWLVPLAGAILFVQRLASRAWLARYRYGPVEWAWRCLSYGRRLPLRRGQVGAP